MSGLLCSTWMSKHLRRSVLMTNSAMLFCAFFILVCNLDNLGALVHSRTTIKPCGGSNSSLSFFELHVYVSGDLLRHSRRTVRGSG